MTISFEDQRSRQRYRARTGGLISETGAPVSAEIGVRGRCNHAAIRSAQCWGHENCWPRWDSWNVKAPARRLL
jgi:hypothetical protein